MRKATRTIARPLIGFTLVFFCFLINGIHAQQQFDVAITKTTITSAPVNYGVAVPFNFTIYNQGLDSIMNIELIDHFGEGFEFQSGINSGWDEHPTIVNAAITTFTEKIPPGQSRIVTLNLIVRPGDSFDDWQNTGEVISFTDVNGIDRESEDMDSEGNENPLDDAGGLLGSAADNFITGNGMGTPNDGVAATDEDDHDRDSIRVFDLAIRKVLDPITGYSYGDTLDFDITVFNQGNMLARIINVRDIIPEGYIYPVAENMANGWTSDPVNPRYTIDALAPFESTTITIRLVLGTMAFDENAWTNYSEIFSARDENLSNVSAFDADSTPASNSDGERSVQQGDPDDNYIGNSPVNPDYEDDHDPAEPVVFDLALIKTQATALSSFNYGTPIEYEYTIQNQGNVDATDIVIRDSLPCGAEFDQSLNLDWAYDPSTNIATRTLPALAASDQFQGILTLTVVPCTIDQETAWTNYMEISSATTADGVQTVEIDGFFDEDMSNDPGGVPLSSTDDDLDGVGIIDEDNHDVELLQVYDLALKKELITAGPYFEGQELDFRIRVYNQGNIVIQDLIIEDFVPEGYGYDPVINAPLGWTNSYTTIVGTTPTVFPDTLNVMEDLFLATEDSVDIIIKLTLELDGSQISDWYNYAHVWVATDTVGNSRFDDADSNPFNTNALEFAVIPDSNEDDDIFSMGKSVTPQIEEDDHDVANVSFFDLALSKTATSTPTAYGQPVTFDIVVRNEGVQFAHDITIVDYLPCGLTFSSSAGWSINGITGNPEYFYTDTLFAGEEVTIPITLMVEECTNIDADSYRNEAEIINALDDDDMLGDDQDSTPGNEVPGEDDIDDALIEVFDLSLTKTISSLPANFMVGTPVSYNIVITNEGNTPAINTEVTDYLPCGLNFSTTGNMGWSEDPITGNISYVEMSSIDPGSSVTIPLTLTIGTCGIDPLELENLVEISVDNSPTGPVDDFDSTPDNGEPDEDDIDSAPLEFFDLALSKTLTTNTANLIYGQNLIYDIEVTNEGSIPAVSYTVTDYLACGLGFDALANPGWNFDVNTGYVSRVINTTLAPGTSNTVSLILILEECASPNPSAWNNIAEISDANDPDGPADDTDSTPGNEDPDEDDQDDAPFDVFDLSLTKTISSPPVNFMVGTSVSYNIVITNEGNIPAVNTEITDYLPCGLNFSTVGNAGWNEDPFTGNVSRLITESIAPNASVTVSLTLTIGTCTNEPLNLDNLVEISLDSSPFGDIDSTPNNGDPNEDDIGSAPLDFFDLTLSKTISSNVSNLTYGQNIEYTISVTNEGTIPAVSYTVTDYLPCGLGFDASANQGIGWNYDVNTSSINRTVVSPLNPGQTNTFTLNLTLQECANPNSSAWNNIAEITEANDPDGPADDTDSTPGNGDPNEDDQDEAPFDVFDLNLSKTVVSNQQDYIFGEDVVYSITVMNQGSIEASGFQITDFIPCGMSLSTANTLPWSINVQGHAEYTVPNTLQPGNSLSFEIRLRIETCAVETGQRINIAEITNNGSGDPSDVDSTPGNGEPNEDDIDDAIINVNAGSTIGDFVWNDNDGDGIQDSNESGIPNVIVTLYTANGDVVAVDVTGPNGAYEFEEVDPGNYYVVFEVEGDFLPSPTNSGNDANDSNVTEENGPGSTSVFTVVSGQDDETIDAGFFICSLIKGVTYYDINEDDIRQTTENGINGLVVNLYRRVNNVWTLWDSETTHHDYDTPSDDGIWDFCVAPGQYYIEVEMPPIGLVRVRPFIGGSNFDSDINGANGTNTTPTFTLSPGGSKTNLGAGYYPMATVGNRVWFDENSNGIQEDSEPKAEGLSVQVYNMDHELIDETLTDEEGIYEVDYLQKEEYYLKFEAPEGLAFTFADASSDEDKDSDVTHAMGLNTTNPISFKPGDKIINIDAGIISGVLPLKWKDFTVDKLDRSNFLTWTTSHELNVDYFDIQRKTDLDSDFKSIGDLRAVGNSLNEQQYSFDDKNIEFVGDHYYRLKQVDLDGKFSFSDIKLVRRSDANKIKNYPNPTSESISISGLDVDELYTIQIVDSKGIVVTKYANFKSDGNSLDISNLAAGVYELLVFQSNEIIYQNRFIKI